MSQKTEQFIRTFKKLKADINRRAGMPSSHSIEIDRAADRDNTVRRNRALLIYIRDARNLVQHPRHRSDGHAIHISETFLAETQSLLSHLRNPPTASSVGVKRKQMKTAGKTDRLGDLADEMKRCGFSHVPILDEHDVVIGVFNEAAVFSFLWTTEETIVGRQMQISDILSHCRLGTNHAERFKFVSPRKIGRA